jgi:hypothetical protein
MSLLPGRIRNNDDRLSFRQRSYAKCHVCFRTLYSWTARNVPLFTLVNAFDDKTSDI